MECSRLIGSNDYVLGLCKPLEVMTQLGHTPYHGHIPMQDYDNYVQFRISTVRDIEGVTGVNFFPALSATEQDAIELRIIQTLWSTWDDKI